MGPSSESLNGCVRPVGHALREQSALKPPPTRLCSKSFIHTVLYIHAEKNQIPLLDAKKKKKAEEHTQRQKPN